MKWQPYLFCMAFLGILLIPSIFIIYSVCIWNSMDIIQDFIFIGYWLDQSWPTKWCMHGLDLKVLYYYQLSCYQYHVETLYFHFIVLSWTNLWGYGRLWQSEARSWRGNLPSLGSYVVRIRDYSWHWGWRCIIVIIIFIFLILFITFVLFIIKEG